ncbi:cyclic peptide export ABC transporter [Fulvivirga sp.]|uniref:cyclic peptide export ABC transporter n=1 Tax=Fulvivirga sp. TaxID=1931237 RepID=UPI0032EB226C
MPYLSHTLKVLLVCYIFLYSTNIQAQISEEALNEIDEEVLNQQEKGHIPGLSVVLINGEQEIIRNYGYASKRHQDSVTSQTLFELGSCSKAFTALAVMKLAKTKKIDLSDFVSDYLPWFKVSYKDRSREITIQQLLHHTSGIPWNTISLIPPTDAPGALEETVKKLIDLELKDAPGVKYEYATINYDVLALIIEKVVEQPFEDYMQQEIFEELELKSTSIGEPSDTSRMATGYRLGFFSAREFNAPRYRANNAAGYVISNARDMSRWVKFHMGMVESDLYPLAKLTHQRDESVPLHNMNSYAFGWEVSLNGSGNIFHTGRNPNFTSYVSFDPEGILGVVILANSNSNQTAAIGERVMKIMSGEKVHRRFDPGDGGDKVFSYVSIALALYTLLVLAFMAYIIRGIFRGERRFTKSIVTSSIKFFISLSIIVPFIYGVYLLPEAIVGFNWESIMVWTPWSLHVLIVLLMLSVGITYIAHAVALIFPDHNRYRQLAPQIIIASILSGLSNVGVIIMVTSALNTDIELKYLIFFYALILFVYLGGRKFVQSNLIKVTRGLIYDLTLKLTKKIFSTSYDHFERMDRGRVYTALNNDVNTIGQSSNTFLTLITSVITAIGAFLYLASIAAWATLLTISLIISLSTIYYFVSKSTNKYYEDAREARTVFMRLINGMIDGFKELSLHRKKKIFYKDDVAESANEFREKISKADLRFVNAFLVGESLLVVLLGVVAFGLREMFPNIEFYTIMSFVIILLYLIGPINGILGSVPSILQLRVAYRRIVNFIKDIPANQDLYEKAPALSEKIESIEAEGVIFQYKKETSEKPFSVGPINLKINGGEILFIVGGNGSGKTTFAKLLMGLYNPDEGKFKINDQVVDPRFLGEYFSAVFSPMYLFQKLYNIDVDAKKEEIAFYLKQLNLEEKVSIKEDSYSTINLSGGQRKRLALLQCYLEDSPIYLFDEWAADQDPSYRKFFYRTLLPKMRKTGKIIIVISHDDHYFDVADKIVKLDQGALEKFSDTLHPSRQVSLPDVTS